MTVIYDIILYMSNFFSMNNNEPDNLFSKGLQEDNFEDNTSANKNFFSGTEEAKAEEQKAEEQKPVDNSLDGQYNALKNNYEQIFIEAAESIRKELDTIKPKDACEGCSHNDCSISRKDIFAPYPASGCKLREWQMQAITYLTGDYKTKLKAAHKEIMEKKNNYECNKCGACCKLAVSEYSEMQLKQRAMKGDKFSEGFTSVFIPYETEEEAKSINPEYFVLLNRLVEDDRIYYYHCPKIDDCNLCTIYEERPDICKDFPHNPLKLLPSECSFNAWRNEVSHQAMLLKAKTDIVNFYKEKLG